MTFPEFLQELRTIKGFRLTEYGLIRRKCGMNYNCPITAVASKRLGLCFALGNPHRAARALCLSCSVARIVRASDNQCRTAKDHEYRRELLNALGLRK